MATPDPTVKAIASATNAGDLTKPPPERAKEETNSPAPKHTRPKFTKAPRSGRRGGAAYTQQEKPSSLHLKSRISYYQVFTSNLACYHLGRQCHQVIEFKDYRLAQNITVEQLQYVLTIAWISRTVQIANRLGYAMIQGESLLKLASSGIQLPNLLAQYVECLGTIELSSGANLVPRAGQYRDMFPKHHPFMMDPGDLLQAAGRPIPLGEWPIDRQWILEYNEATTRAARSGIGFRKVDYSTTEGRVEQIVSYRPIGDGLYVPYAPQRITEAQAHLGVIYRFRDRTDSDFWYGVNQHLVSDTFIGLPMDPLVEFSNLCVDALRPSVQ